MKFFKKHGFTNLVAGVFAAVALTATSASAASAIIEQAKNECIVGEQADGYLGVVTGASPGADLRREVRDINQRRKAYYADIARRNGVSVEVTAVLTAEKLIGQAKSGQCVRNQRGDWSEK